MSEAILSRRLRAHLSEVYFVFRHLPKRLVNVAKLTPVLRWREAFLRRARAVQEQQQRLLRTLLNWGTRPAPCECEEVSGPLNDLRYTAKANHGADIVLERATRAADRLATLVRKRLFEALRLSRSIREDELADSIEELIGLERDAPDAPAPSS